MWTLHFYLGRELLKTFLMTATALTLLIVMGGGVGNIFLGEGIGATELAKVFLYLAPVAVTLILPVAALFSAAITFGRAALDNEVLACRAAGINIHRILVSPAVLGLLVTTFTYFSWNYLTPYLTASIYEVTRRDLPAIVAGQFQKAKPLTYGKYKIAAKHFERVGPADLPEDVPKDFLKNHTLFQLAGVSFLEIDNQELIRYGTAEKTIIDFDNTGTTPRVTVDMQGVRSFDAKHRQYHELDHQILGPIEIPLPIKRKIKFEPLGRLLQFRDDPMAIPVIQDYMHGMRREMRVFFLNQDIEEHLNGPDRTCRLKGDGFDFEITAEKYQTNADDGRITLGDVRVKKVHSNGAPTDVYVADQARVQLRKGLRQDTFDILLELNGNVQISREPAVRNERVVRKPKEVLPKVAFDDQPTLLARYEAFDMTSLFDPATDLNLFQKQERMQTKLIKRVRENISEVRGEIHFRASYALAAIAIIVLGAVLGIIVRGGQVLTAFGISCIPMLIVVIASIVGRNLADRPDYTTTSITVMWGSTVFMYAATTFMAFKVLKR